LADLPKPPRTFDITVNGEKQTIVMSYGLFHEVAKVVPSPEQITDLLLTDPYLRDYVIRRLLTGNKKVEKDEDLVDLFDLDVDLDEVEGLVSWAAEHVLHFFMRSAGKMAKTGEKYQATIQELTQLNQSLPGSQT
jgi:hypothetical protein